MDEAERKRAFIQLLCDEMSEIAERAPLVAAMLARMFVRDPELAQQYLLIAPVWRFTQKTKLEFLPRFTLDELNATSDVEAKIERAKMFWRNRRTEHDLLQWMEHDLENIDKRIAELLSEEGEGGHTARMCFIKGFLSRLYVSAFEAEAEEAGPKKGRTWR